VASLLGRSGTCPTWRRSPTCAHTLVVGYGNPLREDDGIGWRAAELIERKIEAEIVYSQQLLPELAARLAAASLVIFLDASLEQEPGGVQCRPIQPEEPGGWSHHLSPGQLLGFAKQLNGAVPAAFLITGGALRMELGDQLTEAGQRAAERMAEVATSAISLMTL